MSEPTKTPIGTAWIDDGVLWHRLDFGVKVSETMASQTVETLTELLEGRALPAIVDIGNIQFAGQEARDVFTRLGSDMPEIATALLIRSGANPAPAVLANLFAEEETDRPVAVFSSEEDAVAWARSFLD